AGVDRDLKVTGQLGAAGDTITQTIWRVHRIR
ncbi:hypothetical protein LCGC14_2338200, partial [marine sediment metagenome]